MLTFSHEVLSVTEFTVLLNVYLLSINYIFNYEETQLFLMQQKPNLVVQHIKLVINYFFPLKLFHFYDYFISFL